MIDLWSPRKYVLKYPNAYRYLFEVFGYNREMACSVFVSYVEIYNDTCYDLLDDSDVRQSKVIRTDSKGINYVEGATEVEVSSSEEVIAQHLKGFEYMVIL